MLVIGIDPGLSGAVAYLQDDRTLRIFDMPVVSVMRNSKKKNELSPNLLAGSLMNMIKEINDPDTVAVMERVNAMSGQGVSSVFSFGRSSGIVEGVLATLNIPLTLVTPQAWIKAMGVRGGKDASRERAMQLFPDRAALFKRVKDNGRSDAALIAEYGRSMLKNSLAPLLT